MRTPKPSVVMLLVGLCATVMVSMVANAEHDSRKKGFNFDYTLFGKKEFLPYQVYDNGEWTFLHFPDHLRPQSAAVINAGVRTRRAVTTSPPYYVIRDVGDKIVLQVNNHKVVAERARHPQPPQAQPTTGPVEKHMTPMARRRQEKEIAALERHVEIMTERVKQLAEKEEMEGNQKSAPMVVASMDKFGPEIIEDGESASESAPTPEEVLDAEVAPRNFVGAKITEVLRYLTPPGWDLDIRVEDEKKSAIVDMTFQSTRRQAIKDLVGKLDLIAHFYPGMKPKPLVLIVERR